MRLDRTSLVGIVSMGMILATPTQSVGHSQRCHTPHHYHLVGHSLDGEVGGERTARNGRVQGRTNRGRVDGVYRQNLYIGRHHDQRSGRNQILIGRYDKGVFRGQRLLRPNRQHHGRYWRR